ncbi:MAG: zinc-dependent alcohol dehydrogenase [Candidatus Geothermincolia bacterium]
MLAAVLREPGQVELTEMPKPVPGPAEVLVRITNCAICSLERRLYTGDQKLKLPLVPGHEVAGYVEEVGPRVLTAFEPGQHVTLDLLFRCGECYFCRTGNSNHCVNMWRNGNRVLGGMAQYISVPAKQVFAVDSGVSPVQASLTEPLSDCIHSLRRARLSPETTVLIIGAGTMGLMHLAVLSHWGVTAMVSDYDQGKLQVAAEMGAAYVLDCNEGSPHDQLSRDGLPACDVVVVAAPGKPALDEAVAAAGIQGTIILFASNYPPARLDIDANLLHYKELTITGSESRTERDFLQAASMQNSGDLYLGPLVSAVIPLAQVQEAFELALDPHRFRIVLDLGS